MSQRKRIVAKKKPRKTRRPAQKRNVTVDPGNKRRFDQLLDDAILGVKRKA